MDIGWQLRRRRRHAVPGVPEIGNWQMVFGIIFNVPQIIYIKKGFSFHCFSTKLCYCGQNCASDDE